MGERAPKRPSFGSSSNDHRLSDGLYTFTSTFAFRPSEMTESLSQTFLNEHHQLTDRAITNSLNRNYHRSIATTVVMTDDEIITTPTKRTRRNSVLEEGLLSAGNYLKRKFSYGSID